MFKANKMEENYKERQKKKKEKDEKEKERNTEKLRQDYLRRTGRTEMKP